MTARSGQCSGKLYAAWFAQYSGGQILRWSGAFIVHHVQPEVKPAASTWQRGRQSITRLNRKLHSLSGPYILELWSTVYHSWPLLKAGVFLFCNSKILVPVKWLAERNQDLSKLQHRLTTQSCVRETFRTIQASYTTIFWTPATGTSFSDYERLGMNGSPHKTARKLKLRDLWLWTTRMGKLSYKHSCPR